MRVNSRTLTAVTAAIAICALTRPACAGPKESPGPPWTVQVEQVDAGGTNIAPEFKVAIYENLLGELIKSKRFSAVIREGDRRANDVPRLLILKTTVQSYTQGSETKRAVTTVGGATKLKVKTQLCTPQGQVVYERVVDASVRLFGGNLRATETLARKVADDIKHSALSGATPSPVRS